MRGPGARTWGLGGLRSGGLGSEQSLNNRRSWETLNILTLLPPNPLPCVAPDRMIEVVCNDRLGKKVRVKCKYPRVAERQ